MFFGTSGQIWKRCMPEMIFFKKEFQMRDFESFIFWSKFCVLLGTTFFFFYFWSSVADIFTQSPHPKKASYAPENPQLILIITLIRKEWNTPRGICDPVIIHVEA